MLIELLRRGAAEAPDRVLVLSHARRVTYAQCLARSEALARGLHARSIARFAAWVADPADLLALLCASSAAGSEACVYPDHLDAERVDEFAATFEHRTVVTDRELPPSATAAVVPVADLVRASGALPPAPSSHPAMILTTGTTGRPKAVRHDWTRLAESARRSPTGPAARWLLAYNLNQFAGIQILLHVLASGATLVVGASRQPRDAVAAMRDLGVTHASGTPTFWRLVAGAVDEATARRLALEQITLGGEAVPAPLLDELKQLFPAARISQVYAANEFGSMLSVRDGRSGLPLAILDRGDDADVQFRIVDGELHVRSRVGMLGYHGDADTSDGWRPTGDLVEVRGDRIHFAGRKSEIINVGGVKVHPLPVEERVSGVEGVRLARAYGRPSPVTGEVVGVDVVAGPGVDTERLADDIRAICSSLPPAVRPRQIRFVSQLDLRDNKISRRRPALTR